MPFLSAWASDGPLIPASMARRETYRDTKGATGITLPEDLKVIEKSVPGGAVTIMPGSGVMLSRFPSVAGESYGVANDAAFDLSVPATGSGAGATRYVIVRIDVPETMIPPYPELVSSLDNLNYAYLPLAKIVQPASTATITQSLITDMRMIADPQSKRELRAYALVADDVETLTAEGVDGEYWPNGGGQYYMDIPEWASQMQVRVDFGSVFYPPGNTWGYVWMEYGPKTTVHNRTYASQKFRFDSPNVSNNSRTNFIVADTMIIPAVMRGTRQLFITKGRIDGKSANSARPQLTSTGGIIMDITFNQIPV